MLDPAGNLTVSTYAASQITRDSAGVYHLLVTLNRQGTWSYRFEGTGAVIAAADTTLICLPNPFYPN